MRILIILFAISLTMQSCQRASSKNEKVSNEIVSISLSTGSCYGKCSEMDIELRSSFDVIYFGGSDSNPKGLYEAKMTKDQWLELVEESKLVLEKFKSDTILPQLVNDDALIDLQIQTRNKSIRINGYSLFYPSNARKLVGRIYKIQKELRYKKTTKKHDFKTSSKS